MKLDPDDLRAYARRDWDAPERLSRAARAAETVAQRVERSKQLYAAMRRTKPGWPTKSDRLEDLRHHLRVKALLDRAAPAFPPDPPLSG